MSTGFPFASLLRALTKTEFSWPKYVGTAFASGLGSTHPCASTVHMEPFSTSALKDLT